MDLNGRIIISRDYRGDVPMSISQKFTKRINNDDDSNMKPIWTLGEYTFAHIIHNNVIIMAITKHNANAMVILNFLYRIVEVFTFYFNELEEESIRDNFVLIYELMDEMMDFGYPQSTDAKVLKEFLFIKEQHKLKRAPALLTQKINWRAPGIVHKKNEVFLDVVETLELLVSANGTVLHSEVKGELQMKSYLSGMPELKLGLNDKVLYQSRGKNNHKSVDMEDIRFHQCVPLQRFENDRSISFIPPDGEFTLMTYRLSTKVKPLIWAKCEIQKHKGSRIEYLIRARSNFKRRSTANDVELIIPVPSDAYAPKFKTSIGNVEWQPDKASIIWKIKNFPGERKYLMRAHFGLPSIEAEDHQTKDNRPIRIKFVINYLTISGIQVRYLKIIEREQYDAASWCRYLTKAHKNYCIRIN